MQIFYTPDNTGGEYILNEEESKHAIRVLRMAVNDEIGMIDGKGTFFKALITDPNPKKCKVLVKETFVDFEKRFYRLHIAISLIKNQERFEWFLEKSTEIGIDEITPLLCERSEKKNINMERCNRILESAMKQSINAYHPKLNPITKFNELIGLTYNETKLIATCQGERNSIQSVYNRGSEALLLIGPEGDFTEDEVNIAKRNRFKPVTLGTSRLRTETAGVIACHTVHFLNSMKS